MAKGRFCGGYTDPVQLLLYRIDLDAILLQSRWIVAGPYGDRIPNWLPVRQIVKEQCCFMGEYGLLAPEMLQIHGIYPSIR